MDLRGAINQSEKSKIYFFGGLANTNIIRPSDECCTLKIDHLPSSHSDSINYKKGATSQKLKRDASQAEKVIIWTFWTE
jgi:hypothetical protein